MQSNLFSESREKYTLPYNAELKAEIELETVPQCYNYCV